jgi:hypothetical protein
LLTQQLYHAHTKSATVHFVGPQTNNFESNKMHVIDILLQWLLLLCFDDICGLLSQALFLPPSPFLSATSLPSPVLLQIFASRIYVCTGRNADANQDADADQLLSEAPAHKLTAGPYAHEGGPEQVTVGSLLLCVTANSADVARCADALDEVHRHADAEERVLLLLSAAVSSREQQQQEQNCEVHCQQSSH